MRSAPRAAARACCPCLAGSRAGDRGRVSCFGAACASCVEEGPSGARSPLRPGAACPPAPSPRKMPSLAERARAAGSASARQRAYASASGCSGEPTGAPISPTHHGAAGPASTRARTPPTANASCSVRMANVSAAARRSCAKSRTSVEEALSRNASDAAMHRVKISDDAATAPRATAEHVRPTNSVSTTPRNGSMSVLSSAGPAMVRISLSSAARAASLSTGAGSPSTTRSACAAVHS